MKFRESATINFILLDIIPNVFVNHIFDKNEDYSITIKDSATLKVSKEIKLIVVDCLIFVFIQNMIDKNVRYYLTFLSIILSIKTKM